MSNRRLRNDFDDRRDGGPQMHQAGANAVLFLAFVLITGWLIESRRRAKKARRSSEICDSSLYAGASEKRELMDVNQAINDIVRLLRAEAARYPIPLWVIANANQGTTFHFTLPAAG